jgi:SH3 domain-containing YSC84-like protein 1
VAVVPELKSAAFVFNTKCGKGYLSCRKARRTGWPAPATIRIEGGSVSFQLGGEEIELVALIVNEGGENKVLQSKSTLGGDASFAAGPVSTRRVEHTSTSNGRSRGED